MCRGSKEKAESHSHCASSHLVKLLLLLFQVGDTLPQVVLVHQHVVQLLLEARLGFVQLFEGGTFLTQGLGGGLQLPLEPLLSFLGRLQANRVLLHLLPQFGKL